MRAWWGVLAALALIALGGVTRVLTVILMIGLGWLVFRGPRERLAGLVMLVVGGYFALVLPLSFAVLANTDISLPPLALEVYQYPTNLMLWAGAVVMVLGMVHLLWPSARLVTAGATPEPSANRGQVSAQP